MFRRIFHADWEAASSNPCTMLTKTAYFTHVHRTQATFKRVAVGVPRFGVLHNLTTDACRESLCLARWGFIKVMYRVSWSLCVGICATDL